MRLELRKLNENVLGVLLDNVPGILQSNDKRQFPSRFVMMKTLCYPEFLRIIPPQEGLLLMVPELSLMPAQESGRWVGGLVLE